MLQLSRSFIPWLFSTHRVLLFLYIFNILFKIFAAVFLNEINHFFPLLGYAGTTKRGGGLTFFFNFMKEFTYKRSHYFPLNIWMEFTHETIWAYSFFCRKVFKLWIQFI